VPSVAADGGVVDPVLGVGVVHGSGVPRALGSRGLTRGTSSSQIRVFSAAAVNSSGSSGLVQMSAAATSSLRPLMFECCGLLVPPGCQCERGVPSGSLAVTAAVRVDAAGVARVVAAVVASCYGGGCSNLGVGGRDFGQPPRK